MNSKQVLLTICTGLACLIIGVILIPLAGMFLYRITNIILPIWVMLLVEVIAMIGIVAVHSWALLKEREIKPAGALSVIEELKDQLDELKVE
jgi:hypothetical protein